MWDCHFPAQLPGFEGAATRKMERRCGAEERRGETGTTEEGGWWRRDDKSITQELEERS